MLHYVPSILYVVAFIFSLVGILYYANKNKKKQLFSIILFVNLMIFPFSFFIGGMATDSPDSTLIHFFKGFLFVQGLPLLTFLAPILYKNKSQEA